MSSLEFKRFGFNNHFGNNGDIIELPEMIQPSVKSDFYINAPQMKVDKLVLDAETDLLKKLVSIPSTTKSVALDKLTHKVLDKYKNYTRGEISSDDHYFLKDKLVKTALAATISVVSSRFRKSNIDNNLRYLLSNEVFYAYCLYQAVMKDKVKDAGGLFGRVQSHASELKRYLNKEIAANFIEKNNIKIDKDVSDFIQEKAGGSAIPYSSGALTNNLDGLIGKVIKYGALPQLVEDYIQKKEIDITTITPDIKNKMIEHLYKMGVQVSQDKLDISESEYDEYLALAYSHARKLSGGLNDPLKNLFSDVAVDTFDYKVDYFETIEEQSIDRSHILGAAVLFYTKVLSDDLGLLRIADAIIMAWTQGKLDIPHGETATKLYRYYKLRKERMTAEERSMFYKIVFNTGNAEVLENSVVNTDFPKLWNSLMQESVKYIQKLENSDNAEDFVSRVGVNNSIKNLQYNLSVFMTGMIKSLLPEMYAQLQSAIEIIKQPEVVSQLGQGYQRNMWKVVERIGTEVFNSVPNVSALKTVAIKGHSIFTAIASFDEAQFTDESFRKLITDVEEFIVANGQIDGKVMEGNDEEDSDEDEREEKKGKGGDWDF
jgi:hypothetical protein